MDMLAGSDRLTFTDDQEQSDILCKQSKLMRYFNRPKCLPWSEQKYQEYYQLNSFKPQLQEPPKYVTACALDYSTDDDEDGIARNWVYTRCCPNSLGCCMINPQCCLQ
jgi:hypothetical protein